jgi:hypothetical protein
MDILGLIVVFFALIVIGVAQTGLTLGLMYGMHRIRDNLPQMTETQYGEFDFDNFQKPAFQEMLVRLAILFIGTTLIVHMLEYFFVGKKIVYHRGLWILLMFVVESGAIGAGLWYLFKLDRFRLAVLTGGSAFFYFFFLWYLTSGKLLWS